jgi:hypothetical protein
MARTSRFGRVNRGSNPFRCDILWPSGKAPILGMGNFGSIPNKVKDRSSNWSRPMLDRHVTLVRIKVDLNLWNSLVECIIYANKVAGSSPAISKTMAERIKVKVSKTEW